MTPESFDLDSQEPTVTVEAGYSKRRRADTQPLPLDFLPTLKRWMSERPKGRPVFPIRRLSDKTAKMLRRDLGRAEIPYVNEDQRGRSQNSAPSIPGLCGECRTRSR